MLANTRKTLERVPEDKFGWKPHEKSGTMGWLATHLANLPSWAISAIDLDSLDLAPGGVRVGSARPANSRKEVLEIFDKNVTGARAAIAGASDAHLLKPWLLLMGGRTIFTLPRIAVLRSAVMNHNRARMGREEPRATRQGRKEKGWTR